MRVRVAAGLLLAAAVCLPGCSTLLPTASGPSRTPTSGPGAPDAAGQGEQAPRPDFTGIPDGASPLSGRKGGADKKVIVVKLDNTPNAQPHAGLRQADVVYVEEVEYGLTRLAAVYSTRLPAEVGPVRSARITDVTLFAQYGTPAFAYSGAQKRMRPVLDAAPFVDVSGDLGPSGYWREPGRPAPYNFFADLSTLLDRGGRKVGRARDIGFVFSETPPPGGRRANRATVRWPSSTVSMRWHPRTGTYEVWLDGAPARAAEGGTQQAATVVVQQVQQTDSGYGDRYGGKTPLALTMGTGKAVVLRDGKAWDTTWVRRDQQDGTRYYLADGTQMPFAVGQEWILLVPKGVELAIG